MDIEKICRICLELGKEAFDIFTSYYVKRNTLYSEMLSECTIAKPQIGDGLPRLICKECSKQLRRSYVFYILCLESEHKLKSFLANNTIIECRRKNTESEAQMFKEEVKEEDDTPSNLQLLNNATTQDNKPDIKVEPNCDNARNVKADEDIILLEMQLKNKLPEQNDDNESSWEADDDNMFLLEMKLKGQKEDVETHEPKRKRGRKKRVLLEGELPPVPDSKLPHQCDECGKVLSTKSNLKAHKVCHTDLRPYKCAICPATFRAYSALFQHKKIHTGETPYHCEYCPKQFGRRTALVNHLRIHTGEKSFSCEICAKKFVQNAQLSVHMKRHKGDKTFLCQDCGKGFTIKAELIVHQRTHNGEKPYSCHLCPKTFSTAGNLSIHVRIHNKEIRYNCKVCQRGFVTCSSYNIHLKRHKGQRDYVCDCGKTFYTSSALKQHRFVHTGEKNYQCKLCERKFTQGSHLTRHVKRSHSKTHSLVEYKLLQHETKSANREVLGILDKAILRLAQTADTEKCGDS